MPVLRDPQASFDRRLFWRMKHRDQRAMREGKWKYLSIEGDEYLFDLAADERERANLARRDPGRLDAMRGRYDAWNARMKPIPGDAKVSLVYSKKDMP